MLVAALVDSGRRLRCGDDDHAGGISTDIHDRDVRAAGICFLPDVPTASFGKRRRTWQRTDRSQSTRLQNDGVQQVHALGGYHDGRRHAVFSGSDLRSLRIGQPLHSGYGPDGDPDRGHDVTYVSTEG